MDFSIFLINSAVPVILSFILFVNSGKRAPARLFLSAAMLNVAIVFFTTYQYLSENFELYIWVHSLGVACILFVYPSFYQYLLMLTGKRKLNSRLFLPGLLFGLVSVIIFHGFLSVEEKIYFLGNYRLEKGYDSISLRINSWFRFLNIAFILFQVVYYYILSLRLLKRYHTFVSEQFANPWEFDLNWVRLLNYSFVLAGFACLSFYVINPVKLFGDSAVLTYPFYLLALVLSALGALGINQREAPEGIALAALIPDVIKTRECIQTGEALIAYNDLMSRTENFFTTQKSFLNPDLKLTGVAAELGTNRTYLSNCINQMTGKSFSTYVNTFRVDHAKSLMELDPRITLDDLASHSGFGSTASFNRTFKEFTGSTPGEYRRAQEVLH